ncbi:Mov34/MPN/PAD-1 family protein [Paucisalibacillus sp. EB02]|uniref:Mov34/MPN/PAD-1 family protein n=1 Tax=Paucisalibacillus sp. EB02 TaxID=1347087 RepID=UPI000694F5E2|nr:M67 family metallopeptidase [Paucisalibacillus sp. EB02]
MFNLPLKKVVAEKAANIFIRQNTIFLTNQVYNQIIYHCRKESPLEACGILSGRDGIICTVWPMRNIDQSAVSFSMSRNEINNVFNSIKKKNEIVLAIYHSHPTAPAIPSRGDIQYNNYPELSHVIVSLQHKVPDIKAYQMVQNQVNSLIIKLK